MKLRRVRRQKIDPMQLMKEKRSLLDRVETEFKDKGVVTFSPSEGLNIDKNYLELPKNITDVTSKDLGEYLNAFTQQNMYMKTLLGWAECLQEDSRRMYAEVSAPKYRELLNSKLSETAKEKEVNSCEDIKPYFDEYMDCRIKISLIKSNIESIESAIFTISREVSRRTGDFNIENRNENVKRIRR